MSSKFLIKKAANGWQYYWVLKAPNSETIAVSEMYNSKAAAIAGVHAVKVHAPVATVEDTTAATSMGRWA